MIYSGYIVRGSCSFVTPLAQAMSYQARSHLIHFDRGGKNDKDQWIRPLLGAAATYKEVELQTLRKTQFVALLSELHLRVHIWASYSCAVVNEVYMKTIYGENDCIFGFM